MDEVNVENITDQLLKRSQDAIWQLECWIQKQENDVNNNSTAINNNIDDSLTINKAKDKQQQYVNQLKSLQRRSLYLKHNIHSTSNENTPILPDVATFDQQKNNRNSVHSTQSDVSYMENLVFEFKDLTLKLNELAQTRKSVKLNVKPTTDGDTSRSSSSSSSSDDSLQLKPLRIISRQNVQNINDPVSSKYNNTTGNEIIEATSSPHNETLSSKSSTPKRRQPLLSSLPSSPIRSNSNDNLQSQIKLESTHRKLRNSKSYHDGLINNKTRQNMTRQQINNPFNSNNRLSLALFQNMKNTDEIYNGNNVVYSDDELEFIEDDTQDELDQNTVLSAYDNGNAYMKTPILTPKLNKFPPLQRSNSHESIFSKRSAKKPLRFYQFVTNTAAPTTRSVSTNDTINSCLEDTTVVSQQMFFKSSYNSKGTSSKALLSDIINSVPTTSMPTTKRNPVQRTTPTATTATSSIFANWSLFGKKTQSNIISETGVCKSRTGILKIKNDKRRPSNASSVVVSAVIKHNKGKTKKLSPSKKPIIDLDIRHNDLQDALNTELIL